MRVRRKEKSCFCQRADVYWINLSQLIAPPIVSETPHKLTRKEKELYLKYGIDRYSRNHCFISIKWAIVAGFGPTRKYPGIMLQCPSVKHVPSTRAPLLRSIPQMSVARGVPNMCACICHFQSTARSEWLLWGGTYVFVIRILRRLKYTHHLDDTGVKFFPFWGLPMFH